MTTWLKCTFDMYKRREGVASFHFWTGLESLRAGEVHYGGVVITPGIEEAVNRLASGQHMHTCVHQGVRIIMVTIERPVHQPIMLDEQRDYSILDPDAT